MTVETQVLLQEWLLILPVLVLLLAPGLGFAAAFVVRTRLALPWVVVLAFAWSTAWCGVVAAIAFYAGLSLDVALVGWLAPLPASAYLLWRTCSRCVRDGGGWRPVLSAGDTLTPEAFVLAAVALLMAAIQQPWWWGTPDTHYHLAASRSLLATGRPIVTDPFFGTQSTLPDSTAGVWNTVHAMIARLTDSDPATLYLALTASGAFLVILSFWILVREVGRSRVSATLATVAYAGFAWSADFRTFAYPNKLSLAFGFLALALMIRMATEPRRGFVIAAGVAASAAIAVHLASAQLVLMCGALMAASLALPAVLRRDPAERRSARHGALAILGAVGIAVLIASPTLLPRLTALSGTSVIGEDSFVWAGDDLVEGLWGMRYVVPGGFEFGGPWLFWLTFAVGCVIAVSFIRDRSLHAGAVLPIVVLVHVITVFPPISTVALGFSSYIVARMVELLRFSPYIALAWAFGRASDRWSVLARTLGVALVAAAVLTQTPYLLWTYGWSEGPVRRAHLWPIPVTQERDIREQFGFDGIFAIRDEFGQAYPTVMAEPVAGYYLMGLATCAMVASLPTHTPVFMDRDEVEVRFEDMETFFSVDASPEERAALLEEYHPDYVFVSKLDAGPIQSGIIREMAELDVVVETPGIILLKPVSPVDPLR